MNWRKYCFVILIALLSILSACYIFSNSLQPSKESNVRSDKVITVVKGIIDPQNHIPPEKMNFLVRKTAHVLEYAVLGVCLSGLCLYMGGKNGKSYLFMGLFFALATAVTDEYIQSFLDRNSQVTDVLIDFSGAVLGFLMVELVYRLVVCVKRKKKSTK